MSKEEVKTGIPNFVIRPAGPDEVPLILRFIIELAEYEGVAHEVEATEEILRENLFGQRPSAEVAFGCFNGFPCGFCPVFPHSRESRGFTSKTFTFVPR